MKIACPHCSQHLELDSETITALEGASHFDCPTCGGAVEVPAPVLVPAKQAPPTQKGKPTPERVTRRTQQGMNRNLLVLGIVALLAIGGVAMFLASKSGGNIFNIFQNTTNQIINNSYFTQLIADGVTTKENLESIAEIRPYGDGFIGVSKGAIDWDQAQGLAKRTGSSVLAVDEAAFESRGELVTWLVSMFGSRLSSSTWVLDQNAPAVLASSEILQVTTAEGERKVLLHWQALDPELPLSEIPRVDGLVANGEWQDVLGRLDQNRMVVKGDWKKTEAGMECLVVEWTGVIAMETSPLETFEARVRYTSPRHDRINVILPSPSSYFEFSMSPYRRTINVGKDVQPLKNQTGGESPHEVHLFVTPGSLKVTLDGEVVYERSPMDWDIDPRPGKHRLGLYLHQGKGTFHSFEIRIPKPEMK